VKKLKCVGKICLVADSNGAQNEVVVLEVKRPKRKAILTNVREKGVNVRKKKNNKIGGEKFLKVASRYAVSDVIPNVRTFSVGGLQEVYQHCSALYFKPEKNTAGCFILYCYGKIKLPPTTIPEELKQLFTDGKSKNFREKYSPVQ